MKPSRPVLLFLRPDITWLAIIRGAPLAADGIDIDLQTRRIVCLAVQTIMNQKYPLIRAE